MPDGSYMDLDIRLDMEAIGAEHIQFINEGLSK